MCKAPDKALNSGAVSLRLWEAMMRKSCLGCEVHAVHGMMMRACVHVQLRNSAYKKVMSAGLSRGARTWLSVKLWFGELFLWNLLCVLAIMEKVHKWRIH